MFQRILVGSDGSECSLKAARAAADLARRSGGTVIGVHVYPRPAIMDPGFFGSGAALTALIDAAPRIHRRVADCTDAVFEEAGAPHEFRFREGHPAACIVAVAEQEKADLIVLGAGSRGSGFHLLGGTSDGVLRHAHCPVLVVR